MLARYVFDELIAPSDVLLDLHGGDMVEALEPFALYDESPVEEQARGLAVAFDLPYVVRSAPGEAPIGGTTTCAAAAAGIPAVIAEVGGCGLLEEAAVQHAPRRARRTRCGTSGCCRATPTPPRADMRSVGRFVWLRSRGGGWWEPDVGAGDDVSRRFQPRRRCDLFGDVKERIAAPEDGVVLFLTTSPAVDAGGLLLGLGVEIGDPGWM